MRRSAFLMLGLASIAAAAVASVPAQAEMGAISVPARALPLTKVGYYCSPGFVASYGRCIATASTDEVDLYLNDPQGYDVDAASPPPPLRRHHRRHGVQERY